MNEQSPRSVVYFGQNAVDLFSTCLSSFLQEDATGKSYVVERDNGLRMIGLGMCLLEDIFYLISNSKNISELDQYEVIVIDSGNSHGDSWIAMFYPRQCVMAFVDQTVLREKFHSERAITAPHFPVLKSMYNNV
jgi:hypothetical protein